MALLLPGCRILGWKRVAQWYQVQVVGCHGNQHFHIHGGKYLLHSPAAWGSRHLCCLFDAENGAGCPICVKELIQPHSLGISNFRSQ